MLVDLGSTWATKKMEPGLLSLCQLTSNLILFKPNCCLEIDSASSTILFQKFFDYHHTVMASQYSRSRVTVRSHSWYSRSHSQYGRSRDSRLISNHDTSSWYQVWLNCLGLLLWKCSSHHLVIITHRITTCYQSIDPFQTNFINNCQLIPTSLDILIM